MIRYRNELPLSCFEKLIKCKQLQQKLLNIFSTTSTRSKICTDNCRKKLQIVLESSEFAVLKPYISVDILAFQKFGSQFLICLALP